MDHGRCAGRWATELALRHPRRSLRLVRPLKTQPRILAAPHWRRGASPRLPGSNLSRREINGRRNTADASRRGRSTVHARPLGRRSRKPRHRKRGLRSRPDSHRACQVNPRAPDPRSARRRAFTGFGGAFFFDRSRRGVPGDGPGRRETQTQGCSKGQERLERHDRG